MNDKLLNLIRLNPTTSSEDYDWTAILKMAEEQSVLGVALKGTQKLPSEMWPPRQVLLLWIGRCNAIERQNEKVNAVLSKLVEELEGRGIKPIVVKKGKWEQVLLTYHFNNHIDRLIPSKQNSRNEAVSILSPQCRMVEQIEEPKADIYDGERLHWLRFHVEEHKKNEMLIFSASSNKGVRTYIYDKVEKYVIVLEPLRKRCGYYLLTAYHLEGKDAARDKIVRMYRRKLPTLV